MVPWWAGNSFALFVFLLLCVMSAMVLLRSLKGKPNKDWKTVDMVIVSIGGPGLISLVFQAQFTAYQIQQPWCELELRGQRSAMVVTLTDAQLLCIPHPRIASSPPDNEEIERDRAAVCAWVTTQFKPTAQRIIEGEDIAFDLNLFDHFPNIRPDIANSWPVCNGDGIRKTVRDWNQALDRMTVSKKQPYQNLVYLLIVFLGPYALSIALALQIVKVIYERRE